MFYTLNAHVCRCIRCTPIVSLNVFVVFFMFTVVQVSRGRTVYEATTFVVVDGLFEVLDDNE